MQTNTHAITLKSFAHYGHRVPPDSLGGVLKFVTPLVRQSIMMAYQGRSVTHGRQPNWLVAASDVRFVDVSGDDDTILYFEAPVLGEAANVFYRQHEFWPSKPAPEETGFDLLGSVINDVSAGNEDSDRFDLQLLERVAGFGKVCEKPFAEIAIDGPRNRAMTQPIVLFDHAQRLKAETPNPQRVRVVGKLDMIRRSNDNFALRLDDGQEIRGVTTQGTVADLVSLFDQRVVVTGYAIYRPSGHLLRVDAENVFPGDDESSFWSTIPLPRIEGIDMARIRTYQGKKSGVAAILGRWPGDETEEELLSMLKELG
jgi:hypothetical protein